MAAVNAQSIKELRERTQAGMSDCKAALTEAEGDMEKAVEIILKKGLAKSAKRAGAVAAEGEVRASVSADKRHATMIEVNIQTDFAARNDAFKHFVGEVLGLAEKAHPGADLHTHVLREKTVGDVAIELTAKIGEKIVVRRWERVGVPEGKPGVAAAYVHLGGKIGVIVALEAENEKVASHAAVQTFAEETAMQIAAMIPLVLRREEVSEDLKAKQRTFFEGQLREDPKLAAKEAAWPKIIDAKFAKWFGEIALLEQESAQHAGKTIDVLRQTASKEAGGAITIVKFVRFERGEGIDTGPKNDFAAEVAKMAGN